MTIGGLNSGCDHNVTPRPTTPATPTHPGDATKTLSHVSLVSRENPSARRFLDSNSIRRSTRSETSHRRAVGHACRHVRGRAKRVAHPERSPLLRRVLTAGTFSFAVSMSGHSVGRSHRSPRCGPRRLKPPSGLLRVVLGRVPTLSF